MKFITIRTGLLLALAAMVFSCKKYVDIDVSPGSLAAANVYTSDGSATSATLALYSYYYTTNSEGYFGWCGSLAADDLQYTGTTPAIQEFSNAAVSVGNTVLSSFLWTYPYAVIREANQVIAGVTNSTAITAATANQLIGEAKFFRAFYFFHLVNYFGAVPITLSTTELNNASLPRNDTAAVYAQIISDLKDAENRLPSAYAGMLRARVNKYAASALLARVYLYTKDYTDAETEATKVIGATDISYSLPAAGSAFVNTSSEVILQFATLYGYSLFGTSYRTSSATAVPTYVLYNNFVNSFEANDGRKAAWVDSVTSGATKYYRINKYKLATATAGNEYNVILRLAEQYLIRAEARAQLNTNLSGAQADINAIRTRAGLGNTPAATQADLLAAVAQERKVELFGEFSHRWFDLKRTGQANAVIGALKPATWKPTAVLMPVPVGQITVNSNLKQNPGY